MPDTTQIPQPIIDLIMADINALMPNISSLTASYRLLVGAAEEIHRTHDICPDVFLRAVERADNAGTIIDMLLEILCYKVAFTSRFLKISPAPVDLFRLLANRTTATDLPFATAEQTVVMAMLACLMECCGPDCTCLPPHTVICPAPPSPAAPPPQKSSDIQDIQAALLAKLQSQLDNTASRQPPLPSRVRRPSATKKSKQEE